MIAAVAVVIGVVALVALAVVWRGFVLSILWGWFMVPLGLPEVGLAAAIGIAGIVAMLAAQASSKHEDGDGSRAFAMMFLVPLISLGIGWIAHQFA